MSSNSSVNGLYREVGQFMIWKVEVNRNVNCFVIMYVCAVPVDPIFESCLSISYILFLTLSTSYQVDYITIERVPYDILLSC